MARAIGLIALKLDVATSTSSSNFGAFLAFTAVNLCVIRQYSAGGEKTRGFGARVFPPRAARNGGVRLASGFDRRGGSKPPPRKKGVPTGRDALFALRYR